MSNQESTLPEARTKYLRDEALKAYNDGFPQYKITAAERNLIQKVLDGKSVRDEKIDKLLDAHFDLERISSDVNQEQFESITKVFRLLRNIRKKSGTESTLFTGSNFDPSSHSVFSSKDVRQSPSRMAKSISREAAHGDWMRELSSRTSKEIATQSKTAEEKKLLKADVEILQEKALRSDARCQAMLIELRWKIQNDAYFAGRASLLARSTFNKYHFDDSLNNVSIGTVRKISEDE